MSVATPEAPAKPDLEILGLPKRFAVKVRPYPRGCWIWAGATQRTGYGSFWHEQRTLLAHRVAYTLLVGSIPEGLVLDHLCRVRNCVNPAHLEPVTNLENIRRGNAGWQSAKTHCIRGHEFTPENTRRYRNKRQCISCRDLGAYPSVPAKKGVQS